MQGADFHIKDGESSEEAFNNLVCLQGWVYPPAPPRFGRVGDGQKRLFFNEEMLVWCL